MAREVTWDCSTGAELRSENGGRLGVNAWDLPPGVGAGHRGKGDNDGVNDFEL